MAPDSRPPEHQAHRRSTHSPRRSTPRAQSPFDPRSPRPVSIRPAPPRPSSRFALHPSDLISARGAPPATRAALPCAERREQAAVRVPSSFHVKHDCWDARPPTQDVPPVFHVEHPRLDLRLHQARVERRTHTLPDRPPCSPPALSGAHRSRVAVPSASRTEPRALPPTRAGARRRTVTSGAGAPSTRPEQLDTASRRRARAAYREQTLPPPSSTHTESGVLDLHHGTRTPDPGDTARSGPRVRRTPHRIG